MSVVPKKVALIVQIHQAVGPVAVAVRRRDPRAVQGERDIEREGASHREVPELITLLVEHEELSMSTVVARGQDV